MPNYSKRFFVPFVGKKYKTGINGKKVLVLGASFYCNKHDCPNFKDCTSHNIKDSCTFGCARHNPSKLDFCARFAQTLVLFTNVF